MPERKALSMRLDIVVVVILCFPEVEDRELTLRSGLVESSLVSKKMPKICFKFY